MTAAIEVLRVRPLTGAGALRAFADVKLGCIVIKSCRIVQQDGQKAWVALPQQPLRPKADGSGSGWVSLVEITNRQVLDELRRAVLAAWEARE
jgi:DNA-binding cell septation regulator SpoVG